ncbi:MAG: PaaI family thioesterase [Dongiaceae bacterium]
MNDTVKDDTNWQRPPSGYADLIGYRITRRDTDYCELELTVEPKHLNRLKVPHGGSLATLIDTAAGIAVAFAQGPDKILPAVTLSLSMQFLGQAKVGDVLTATGRRVGGGRTVAYGTAEIKNQDGRAIARGDATFRYVTPRS